MVTVWMELTRDEGAEFKAPFLKPNHQNARYAKFEEYAPFGHRGSKIPAYEMNRERREPPIRKMRRKGMQGADRTINTTSESLLDQ